MSIIFGIKQPEGHYVEQHQLLALSRHTERWAPDGLFVRAEANVGMAFQPYHTHKRSALESCPELDEFGNMIALDGRLDKACMYARSVGAS